MMKPQKFHCYLEKGLWELHKKAFTRMVPLLLLILVREKPRHGYEIMKSGEDLLEENMKGFPVSYKLTPSNVYPALHKLEEGGFLKSNWEKRKNYYSITPKGREEIEMWKGIFRESIKVNAKVFKEFFNEEVI
jgi:DNA-binding PadR family transcriptional regulator